jgi:hypothetical protein
MLWIPDHLADTLTVTIDPSQSTDADWEGMMMVNQAAIDWLKGNLDTGTYFDMLEYVGVDPLGFVQPVENHVDLLLQ